MGTAVIDITKQGSPPETETESADETATSHYPLSNEAYNVIAALHEKLDALEAYRGSEGPGADASLWEELRRADLHAIYKLTGRLEQTLREKTFFVAPEAPH